MKRPDDGFHFWGVYYFAAFDGQDSEVVSEGDTFGADV